PRDSSGSDSAKWLPHLAEHLTSLPATIKRASDAVFASASRSICSAHTLRQSRKTPSPPTALCALHSALARGWEFVSRSPFPATSFSFPFPFPFPFPPP